MSQLLSHVVVVVGPWVVVVVVNRLLSHGSCS